MFVGFFLEAFMDKLCNMDNLYEVNCDFIEVYVVVVLLTPNGIVVILNILIIMNCYDI